jgi:ribosomal protein L37AE/L43A
MAVAALENQAHIAIMDLFRCPKCGTEYTVTRMTQMPVWKPVCTACGCLFTSIQNGYWLVYRAKDLASSERDETDGRNAPQTP